VTDTTTLQITFAMTAPFWWAMGLLALALLGDLVPGWRGRVCRLFDRLERTPRGSPQQAAAPVESAA
jgi:hypothetical protein